MAKEVSERDVNPDSKARQFGAGERIERTTVDPQSTDIFDDVLKGPKKGKIDKVRAAIDQNDDEITGGDDAADFGEDDGQEEDTVSEGKEEDIQEEIEVEEQGARKRRPKKELKRDGKENEELGGDIPAAEDELSSHEDAAQEQSGQEKAGRVRGKKKKIVQQEDEEAAEVKKEAAKDEDYEAEAGEEPEAQEDALDVYPDDDLEEKGDKAGAEGWDDEEFDYDVDHDAHEPDELKHATVPGRDEIKKTLLHKARLAAEGENGAVDESAEKLAFLSDEKEKAVFIGRKASIYKRYGFEGALQIGKVQEKEFDGQRVFLDSLNPHVVFVCGARGSGKSYVIGVIAEELAEKNRNVGIIVVDPIGVFWSMRFPNKDEKEIEKLKENGLAPKGLNNLKVFIPEGMKAQVPKSTYDAGFAIQPSLLTGEDWALTFGVDRFSVSGLLLDKVLKKVEQGYKKIETNEKVRGKGKNYALEDLIECLETDFELNSKDKGYKQDSIRAISSRFEAAKSWGIFHERGTPLGELSREGQLTILDTSFLEDNVTALVIGILARRLLAARKISTRKEAANKFKSLDMDELLELEIPPTWLFIDEAHTLIPSGNEVTAATAGLIEYVKQGRRPGLSLVFATQQPSAINTKVLSQLDVIMSHKLIFDDDIKAVFKRTPTIMPRRYRNPNFIKTLPVGVAVTGDRREETSRAFVMAIRPRKSQHEGRDAETTGLSDQVDSGQVEKVAIEMLMRSLKDEKSLDMDRAQLAVDTLNVKYRTTIEFKKVLDALAAAGMVVGTKAITVAGYAGPKTAQKAVHGGEEEEIPQGEEDEERQALGLGGEDGGLGADAADAKEDAMPKGVQEGQALEGVEDIEAQALELLSLPQRISEEEARRVVEGVRKKAFLGLLGNAERIDSIRLKYYPLWRIKFDSVIRRGEFISRECFVNSMSGEFMHFRNGNFIESKGLCGIGQLSDEEGLVVKALARAPLLLEEIMAQAGLEEAKTRRILQKLSEEGMVVALVEKKTEKRVYRLKEKMDLPPNERHELLGSLSQLPFVKTEALSVEKENCTKEQACEALKRLWGTVMVKRVEPLYKPVWHVVLSQDARERAVLIDAVNGKIISNGKESISL